MVMEPRATEEGALIQRSLLDSSVFALLAEITHAVRIYVLKIFSFTHCSLAYPSVKSSIRSGVSDRVASSSAATFVNSADTTTTVSRCSFASVHSIILTSLLLCTWSFQYTLALNADTSSRNFGAMAALTEDGRMYSWGLIDRGGGVASINPHKVRAVYSTETAFTLITEEGLVSSWGNVNYGGTKPKSLVRAQAISSTNLAFAALTEEGTVVAWGDSSYGGNLTSTLTNVRTIFSNPSAFAALKKDGTVVAWGIPEHGGSMSDSLHYIGVPANLANVKTIYTNRHAMAALKEDGTVQAWGQRQLGGAGVPANLTNVIAIYATGTAFAALREDGTVQAWGYGSSGGAGVPSDLTHVTTIYSTFFAFCAHLSDGRVLVWGSSGDGGTQPSNLDVVSSISSSYSAFAALTEYGTVVAWGNSECGGGMTDVTIDGVLYTGVPAGMTNVRALYSNYGAFAALMEDGTVQAWGNSGYGGKMPSSSDLRGVQSIFNSIAAFAALKKDGTIFAWGYPANGGSMTDGQDVTFGIYKGVPSSLKNVKTIFGNTNWFADSTAAQLLPCPHNTYGPGFPDCTACPQGSKQPVGRPGIRSKVGSCIDCDIERNGTEKFSTDGRTCDMSCAHGYQVIPYNWYGSATRLDGDMCFTCLPGSYFADADCKLCPLGRYQDTKGQHSCKDCATGKYTRAGEGSTKCSSCPRSKTVLPGKGYAASDCFKICPKGQYGSTGSDECLPCKSGTYNYLTSGTNVCTPCEAGKAQPLTNQTSCSLCAAGKWANIHGATECFECPPGSSCSRKGMNDSEPCPVGRYADTKMRWNCSACPAGRYQDSVGSAKCLFCPKGTFLDSEGATSSALCKQCPSGSYGDKDGLGECTRCPTGQVQPNEGQSSCNDCSLVSKIKTNNAEHTLCVDDQALLSTSVVELMFNKGVALSLAFTVGVIFLGIALAMHHMKEKYSAEANEVVLADLEILQVALKSVLPGFSFGSEMVLIGGMMTEDQGFGGTMLAFRMLHPLTIILLTCILFIINDANRPERLRKMVRMSRLNEKFVRKNVAPVGLLVLASGCDVTMVQLMPWEQSRFYEESMGYPCFDLMTVCMVVKTLQSLVSVICQAAYLIMNSDLSDPTMSIQAKILFSLSITLSMVQLIMGVMMLSLKSALLKKIADEEEEKEEQAKKADEVRETDASTLDIGDLYANNDEEGGTDSIQRVNNPLHSAAMDTIAELREENSTLREELRQYQCSIEDEIASGPSSGRQRQALISPSIEDGATDGQL